MLNPSEAARYRADTKEMLTVPLETATLEQKLEFFVRVSPREPSLRAIYNQHQKTGCKCEYCKTAEGVFAWISKLGEVEKPKPDKRMRSKPNSCGPRRSN
jgi:hypothetical protein